MVGTSRLRKAAQALTAQAPRASNANLEIVSDNGSVAKGGMSAGSAERKRRQPSDDCVQKEKKTGGLCEGGNSVAEPKSMPVETSASKRMRCANPDSQVRPLAPFV